MYIELSLKLAVEMAVTVDMFCFVWKCCQYLGLRDVAWHSLIFMCLISCMRAVCPTPVILFGIITLKIFIEECRL